MRKIRVDYDKIAHLYDQPFRDYEPDSHLISFLNENQRSAEELKILDMGCGTGKQLHANKTSLPDKSFFGSDLSIGMLAQAKKRNASIIWVQADSSKPPFKDETFDYIFTQFSFHHVLDKSGMIANVHRMLKPKGRFFMQNMNPWQMNRWWLYHYFPEAKERDYLDFLDEASLCRLLEENHFIEIEFMYDLRKTTEKSSQLLSFASDVVKSSQLSMISHSHYQKGLQKLRSDALSGKGINSEFCMMKMLARKP